jgi:hypothetical protein
MTSDEKLAAILAAIQTDPGNRGLGKDPKDNLFNACPGDFADACRSIINDPQNSLDVTTGFFIPSASPPAYETDGPLGAAFLLRALAPLSFQVGICSRQAVTTAVASALGTISGLTIDHVEMKSGIPETEPEFIVQAGCGWPGYPATHHLLIEQVGRARDGKYYSMRGRDITEYSKPIDINVLKSFESKEIVTLGIGDGGNEIGMGKIAHETIVKNIPNGDLIHCRVPTDYLIVAGVSNWGAYALAAGIYVLRGVKPRPDLFDPDREREILEVMVREGPLVDGVTGKQTATVDGLSWEEYVKPLIRIREILEM